MYRKTFIMTSNKRLKRTRCFTAITTLCFVIVAALGCDKSEVPPTESYPMKIPFTNFLLEEASCQWTIFETNKVITINSNEELSNYIVCEDNDYPKIDFSKHSLLLTTGWANSSPAEVVEILLQQISKNEYSLHLKIRPGMAHTPGRWNMSIIIPKLLQDAVVALDVQQIY